MSTQNDSERVLLEGANWKELHFYQKSVALFQMTFVFCDHFLPKHGDRTVDQMIQAARSGKQNIIEASEDGKTSTEMERTSPLMSSKYPLPSSDWIASHKTIFHNTNRS